jgi:hypothetical protein
MSATDQSAKRAAVLQYYEQSDAGQFPMELFTADFQFFVPKFGVGRGLEAFTEMAAKMGVRQIHHNPTSLLLIEDGDHVAVEGLTEGVTADGAAWCGGLTPAGRFASVFSFNQDGLIERMHIYLDPDFGGRHTEGFKWSRGDAQAW